MKKPNTNTHKVSSTQTVVKAKRIKLGMRVNREDEASLNEVIVT